MERPPGSVLWRERKLPLKLPLLLSLLLRPKLAIEGRRQSEAPGGRFASGPAASGATCASGGVLLDVLQHPTTYVGCYAGVPALLDALLAPGESAISRVKKLAEPVPVRVVRKSDFSPV